MKTNDLVLIVLIYLIFSIYFLYKSNSGYLKIEFWDVGQGDSILISTPSGKRILIDGGDNFESDFKLSKEIPFYNCRIDVMILTHPHNDHLAGLNRILERCKIGTIMFNDVDYESSIFSSFKQKTENLNVKNILKGDEFEIDNVDFKVLWPSKEFLQKGSADINDTSVVFLVDYGKFEAILTGDATLNVLGYIDTDYVRSFIDGDLDVLKIPHHGSKYSLDKPFYTLIKPKTCVISVGAKNKFGHPSLDVVNFLNDIDCLVLRTDIKGDIEVKTPK